MSKTHLSKELKAAMARQTLLPHGFQRDQSAAETKKAIASAITVLRRHREASWPVVLTAAYTAFNFGRGVQAVWRTVEQLDNVDRAGKVELGARMRETILKCVPFIGIPRVLSCIGALNAVQTSSGYADEVRDRLHLRDDLGEAHTMADRGRGLWNDIYAPDKLAGKLYDKISAFHPELASLIVTSSYGHALSPVTVVGREDTSALAVTVLRVEEDVLDQLTSHVFGLLKGGGDQAYARAIIDVVDNLRTGNMDSLVAKL